MLIKKLIIQIEYILLHRSIDGTQSVLLWNFPSLINLILLLYFGEVSSEKTSSYNIPSSQISKLKIFVLKNMVSQLNEILV